MKIDETIGHRISKARRPFQRRIRRFPLRRLGRKCDSPGTTFWWFPCCSNNATATVWWLFTYIYNITIIYIILLLYIQYYYYIYLYDFILISLTLHCVFYITSPTSKMFRVPNSWTEIRFQSSTSSWINGISPGGFHRGEAQISVQHRVWRKRLEHSWFT